MPKLATYIISIITICLTSCNSWKDGEYNIYNNPSRPGSKTLYLNVPTGGKIGRAGHISKIGSDEKYIIIESKQENEIVYWLINKSKDNPYFNSSEISEGPFSKQEFQNEKRERKIEATFEKSYNAK